MTLTLLLAPTFAEDEYSSTDKTDATYVFGWDNWPDDSLELRGGTTQGPDTTLRTEPSERWKALQAPGLSERERDRAAILAMEGDYRVSFDFLETEVYTGAPPAAPYRSWGTEQAYVVEDTEDRIVLQHVMTMFVVDGEEVVGPLVMKHWRQDWTYEPTTTLDFLGEGVWESRELSDEERAGKWQQLVYQVDDAPRYAILGSWSHDASRSAWDTADAWRPLPRREYSVRDDYQALAGTNRITVTPTGWVHSQDNLKAVLAEPGVLAESPYLARELGVNRYERIVGFEFAAGETYWADTGAFWSMVRDAWDERLLPAGRVTVADSCGEDKRYAQLFGLADEVATGSLKGKGKMRKAVAEVLDCVVRR
jgi:hypothetical protein